MLPEILTVLIILATFFVQYFYLRPKRKYNEYVRLFNQRGYKVLEIPFQPMRAPLFRKITEDAKASDALQIVKKEYSSYDVIISNVIGRVMVEFTHPDFVKSFYHQQTHYNYPKAANLVYSVKRGLGEGLVFSEGDAWKRKRRILNTVFNFEMIKELTPTIARICDESMDSAERKAKFDSSRD